MLLGATLLESHVGDLANFNLGLVDNAPSRPREGEQLIALGMADLSAAPPEVKFFSYQQVALAYGIWALQRTEASVAQFVKDQQTLWQRRVDACHSEMFLPPPEKGWMGKVFTDEKRRLRREGEAETVGCKP